MSGSSKRRSHSPLLRPAAIVWLFRKVIFVTGLHADIEHRDTHTDTITTGMLVTDVLFLFFFTAVSV